MTLTKIPFTDQSATRIYQDYLNRIDRATKSLSKEDQLEIMMELNSHLYCILYTLSISVWFYFHNRGKIIQPRSGWFIPVMTLITIGAHLLLTFFLKLKNRFNHKK